MTRWPRKIDTSQEYRPVLALGHDFLAPGREALRSDGALDRTLLSPRVHRLLLEWARLQNVYGSARLEGGPLAVNDVRKVVDQKHAETPSEEEVLRLAQAYSRIHEAKELPQLTVERICEMHGELFDDILHQDDRPGKLKNEPNGVKHYVTGQVVFEATPPERTPAEMEALLKWFYGPGQLLEPAVSTGLFFVEFQSIHPFMDGNGRLGRLLNQYTLRSVGFRNVTVTTFDLLVFKRREKYYSSLQATNRGENLHVWLRFYCKTLRDSYHDALSRGDLGPILDRVSANSEREILEWALRTGVEWFQRGDYPNTHGYADVTLSTALSSLQQAGFLERTGEKRVTKYRLSETFLKKIYERDVQLDDDGALI